MSLVQVRKLSNPTAAEIDQAAEVLAEAFKSDILVNSCISWNQKFMFPFQRSFTAAAAVGGEVYVASYKDVIVGVALWFGPGQEFLDSPEQRDAGHNELMESYPPELRKWWTEYFLPKYDAQTISVLGDRLKLASWHLQMLGVLSEYQGRGIGGALVREVESKASLQGIATCLETDSEKNLAIYKHLGFVIEGKEEQYESLTGNFPVYVMIKRPKAVS